jgi:hypothetical protein
MKSKTIYIWAPDLKEPKDKTMMHTVEVLRGEVKRGVKLDGRWKKFREVKS